MTDVLVTGLPRSGATVAAALIDHLSNAVCLNAPQWQLAFARRQLAAVPYGKWLAGDFLWQRRQFLNQEPVRDFRAADGIPLLDGYYDPRQPRDEEGKPSPVLFTRPGLKKDFILAMKHAALYTALLPTLVKFQRFKIIAVIRHPLDTITSWKKLEKPVLMKGHPSGIARFWPEALAVMESEAQEVDRLVQLYELFLGRYHELREEITILRYEDIVKNPRIVAEIFGRSEMPQIAGMIEKRQRVHSAENAERIGRALRRYAVFAKEYYTDI